MNSKERVRAALRGEVVDRVPAAFAGITAHLRVDPESTCQGLSVIAESLAGFSRDCIEAGDVPAEHFAWAHDAVATGLSGRERA